MVAPHEPTSEACEPTCSPIRVRGATKHRHGSQGRVRCTGSVVVLRRQRRLPFLHALPTLVEDLLDIVGRSYDGIDYVVLHDIHETMLDPGESDHPLAAVGPTPASKLKGGYFWDGASPKGFPSIEWAPAHNPLWITLIAPNPLPPPA